MLFNSVFYRDAYVPEVWEEDAKETRERNETEELFGRMLCTISGRKYPKSYEDEDNDY